MSIRRSIKLANEGIRLATEALSLTHLNQGKFAHNNGVSRTTVSKLFGGKPIDRFLMFRLCKALKLEIVDIEDDVALIRFQRNIDHSNIKNIQKEDIAEEIFSACHTLSQWLHAEPINLPGGWKQQKNIFCNKTEQLAFKTRYVNSGKDKQYQKQVMLAGISFLLVLTITPTKQDTLTVQVKMQTLNESNFLPPQMQLSLLPEFGKEYSVNTRTHVNCIRLPQFSAQLGEKFRLKISLNTEQIIEAFMA